MKKIWIINTFLILINIILISFITFLSAYNYKNKWKQEPLIKNYEPLYKEKNENIIKHKSISLPVELFYQETNYWCGPASVQMVINYVTNKKISQEKLANYL